MNWIMNVTRTPTIFEYLLIVNKEFERALFEYSDELTSVFKGLSQVFEVVMGLLKG
jgi:hypothetical protein